MRKVKQPPDDLCEAIRAAFEKSGRSILALSKRADVPYSSTHGCIVQGAPLRTGTASKMCKALGLELRPVRKRKDG